MEIIKLLIQIVDILIWPIIILIISLLFKNEIKERIRSIKSVKSGDKEIEFGLEILEQKVEKKQLPINKKSYYENPLKAIFLSKEDPLLTIAQLRVDIEKEIFLLSRIAFLKSTDLSWNLNHKINELAVNEIFDNDFAIQLKDFIKISNQILHYANISDEIKEKSILIGSNLASQVHYYRVLFETERLFEDFRMWHLPPQEYDKQFPYHWWAAVAALCPKFDYNYDIYRLASERHLKKMANKYGNDWPKSHMLYILPLKEFVKVLEFRERELVRLYEVIKESNVYSQRERKANIWNWPSEWGKLHWTGPIIDKDMIMNWDVEGELLQTRSALNRYKPLVKNS